MSLPEFKLLRPCSVEEAVGLLGQQAQTIRVLAGGTDAILVDAAETVRTASDALTFAICPQLKGVHTRAGKGVEIGALTTLREIEQSSFLRKHYPVLTEAAATVASPCCATWVRSEVTSVSTHVAFGTTSRCNGAKVAGFASKQMATVACCPRRNKMLGGILRRHAPSFTLLKCRS